MIELRDLTVEAGGFLLENISLKVNEGEYFVILGPTGSGKTLLLETIMGICKPKKGSVLVKGVDVSNEPPEKRNIGFIYQDYMLFPHLDVSGNISFGLKTRKLQNKETDARVRDIARLMEIEPLLPRNVRTLSGGERQRTALARSIVTRPDVLLLDEPLSALDPRTKERLRAGLKKIHCEIKTTTIHVTHDFEEAMILADRIAVMNGGKIIQTGTPDTIFHRPESEFVARFMGAENLFRGESRIIEGLSEITLKDMPDVKVYSATPRGGSVRVTIPAGDILLSKERIPSSARNNLEGRIIEISVRGPLISVVVDAGVNLTALVTKRALEELDLTIDSQVYASFKAFAVHAF